MTSRRPTKRGIPHDGSPARGGPAGTLYAVDGAGGADETEETEAVASGAGSAPLTHAGEGDEDEEEEEEEEEEKEEVGEVEFVTVELSSKITGSHAEKSAC
jgi:hypothetical protein